MKMQANKNGFLRNFCVAALVSLLAQCVWAATPVAVWEGDFSNLTQDTLTINLNGNTCAENNSYLQIKEGATGGILINDTTSGGLNIYTMILKCSDINLEATSAQVLFTSKSNTSEDRVGVNLPAKNTACRGIWGCADWTDASVVSAKLPEGYTALVYNHQQSGGTYAYAIVNGAASQVFNREGLRASNDTYTGIAIGGLRGTRSGSTALDPAVGMKITGIAIFKSTLTTTEMASYRWPSQTVVYTGTVAGGQVTWDKPLPETPAANDYLKFVGAGDIAVPANYASFGQITIGEGVNLTGVAPADVSSGKFEGTGAIVIKSDCTLTVPAGVTVKTRGNIAVNLTNDGTFDVESGTCSVNTPDKQKIKGTVIIRKNAKFVNKRESDALAYGSSAIVHVYGTLDFESTRWTLGGNNKIYLYTDAVVEGAGQGNDGALDFNSSASDIYVKPNGSTAGKVTCSATFRTANKATITIDQGMELEVSSVFKSNNDNVTKAGAGLMTVKSAFATGATVNAGTLKLVGISPTRAITMAGGTLELAQNANGDAYTFTGTVASSALGNGTIKTAGSTVTLSGTFTNFSGDMDSSAANSKFIIPKGQEATVGYIISGSKIEIEGMLVHTNKVTNNNTSYQNKDLSGLTGNGTFKITGPHYFFTCGTDSIAKYWAPTLALWNDRGDSTIANNKGIVFGQPVDGDATITIGSLSGAGLIRTDANNGDRTIKIVQAKNTEWSGAFNAGDRVKAIIVTGADGATEKTLTLSGTQTHNNDLLIESAGSVKLTGTWIATTTTVNGRLEVLDTATLTTTLTSAGSLKTANSTVYFGSDELASAEAAAKAGTTYYATIADAVAAATLADITVINASAEVPSGYAKVTKDDVVTLRQKGDVYYVQGYFTTGTDQNPLELVTEDGGATTFLDGDKIIVGSKTTKTDAWFSADSRLTKLQFSKDFTMHAGTTDAILNNATITVDEGMVLTISPDRANTKLGAVTINGAVSVSGTTPLAFASVEGTSTITLADGKSITIGTKGENVTIASGVVTKRVVETEVAGGIKYSLETIQPEPPTPTEGGITPSIPGADKIEIVDAEGTTVEGGTIPLVTGVYTVTGKVGETVVATETLAVVKSKDAESGSSPGPVTTAVAVPFKGATVANLLNTALLKKGDELKAFVGGSYSAWTLTENKTWAPVQKARDGEQSEPGADATAELKRGSAVWVTTAGKVVAFGAYDSTEVEPEVTPGHNLIGNPMMTAITPEAKTVGDVLIPIGGSELVRYKVIEKAGGTKVWQCTKSVKGDKIPGTDIPAFSEDISEDAPTVDVGGSVWLIK